MTRSEFSVPVLGTVRRSTLVLTVLFLAVLALYLLVRPAPEIAPTGRTAESKEAAEISRSEPDREAPESAPERPVTPSATPRARTPTSAPVPAPTASRSPADLPDPGAGAPASANPLLPLLAPLAPEPADPGPGSSTPPAPPGR